MYKENIVAYFRILRIELRTVQESASIQIPYFCNTASFYFLYVLDTHSGYCEKPFTLTLKFNTIFGATITLSSKTFIIFLQKFPNTVYEYCSHCQIIEK
jgi:hypothetical protein